MDAAAPVPAHAGPSPEMTRTLGLGRGARVRRVAWRVGKYAALAAVVGAGLLLYLRSRRPAPAPTFVTAVVGRGELRVVVSATGRVEAATTVDVGAEVSGRILSLTVDDNDAVTRGQILAVIDGEQLRAALTQERAQLAAARASVRQARATQLEARQSAARTSVLAGQALATTQAEESATAAAARADAAHDVASANAALAAAGVAAAQSRLAKATIRSPIDGIVLDRLVEPGQTVTAGFATPVLFTLAEDLTRMTLSVDVDEADVGRVAAGNPASFTVDSYPGRSFLATVVRLSNQPTIAQNVVTYQAQLEVDNHDRLLRPGMTATAVITTEVLPDVILVPNAALRFTPPGEVAASQTAGAGRIWLAAGAGATRPTAVEVTVGASDGAMTEIRGDAVAIGARVLVEVETAAQARARTGARVP
jgi:HlyD family secretion protein